MDCDQHFRHFPAAFSPAFLSAFSVQPRIYLDEWSGAVLGANVMQDHEVRKYVDVLSASFT
jgi:hypothetical protein